MGLARHPEHGLVLHIDIKAMIVVLVTTQAEKAKIQITKWKACWIGKAMGRASGSWGSGRAFLSRRPPGNL